MNLNRSRANEIKKEKEYNYPNVTTTVRKQYKEDYYQVQDSNHKVEATNSVARVKKIKNEFNVMNGEQRCYSENKRRFSIINEQGK